MRQGFFGIKNVHIAILTDEDQLTYETPVHIPGTVELNIESNIGSSTTYADNEPWIKQDIDNGFTGTLSIYDADSTQALRQLFARLSGYAIDSGGRIIGLSERSPEQFALMCEQPGSVVGKRKCLYKCQLEKPSMDAKTTEDSPEITQLDYEFTAMPIKLESGENATFYDDFEGSATYDTFFSAVATNLTEATSGTGGN